MFTANGVSGEVTIQSGDEVKFEWQISGGHDPGDMELEINPEIGGIDYSDQGSYDHSPAQTTTYTLKVTDNSGKPVSAQKDVTVTVEEFVCNADATFTPDPTDSLTVNFDTSATTGELLFDYGDGSEQSDQASHIYADAGEYTVTLTATVSPDCTDTKTQTVTVEEPICNAVATFTFGTDGLTATFDPSGSYEELLWDYGDGGTGTENSHTSEARRAGMFAEPARHRHSEARRADIFVATKCQSSHRP